MPDNFLPSHKGVVGGAAEQGRSVNCNPKGGRGWPCSLYRCYDSEGNLLYVGCSWAPMARVQSHCCMKPWATIMARVEIEWFASRKEAKKAEEEAIASEGPIWNVHHKIGKRFQTRGKWDPKLNVRDESTWASGQHTENRRAAR